MSIYRVDNINHPQITNILLLNNSLDLRNLYFEIVALRLACTHSHRHILYIIHTQFHTHLRVTWMYEKQSHTHARINTNVHAYSHMYLYMHVHKHTLCTHTHMYWYTHTHMHAHKVCMLGHTCMYVCKQHTCIHTCSHACTYALARTHTHAGEQTKESTSFFLMHNIFLVSTDLF